VLFVTSICVALRILTSRFIRKRLRIHPVYSFLAKRCNSKTDLTVFDFAIEYYAAIFTPSLLSKVSNPLSGIIVVGVDLLTHLYFLHHIYHLSSGKVSTSSILVGAVEKQSSDRSASINKRSIAASLVVNQRVDLESVPLTPIVLPAYLDVSSSGDDDNEGDEGGEEVARRVVPPPPPPPPVPPTTHSEDREPSALSSEFSGKSRPQSRSALTSGKRVSKMSKNQRPSFSSLPSFSSQVSMKISKAIGMSEDTITAMHCVRQSNLHGTYSELLFISSFFTFFISHSNTRSQFDIHTIAQRLCDAIFCF
jgi:hypothetical protein